MRTASPPPICSCVSQAALPCQPMNPQSQRLSSCPFPAARLIVFFAVYLGICQNYNFSRYVRYNAMQAILLDIILM